MAAGLAALCGAPHVGAAETRHIETQGANLRQWRAKDGPKTFKIDGARLSFSKAKNRDGDYVARIELGAPALEPVTLTTDASGLELSVAFDVFPIDPKNSKKDVLLSWFTGGAHCCGQTDVASLVDGRWKIADLGAWNGANLERRPRDIDGDGAPDFVFGDDRFLYVFDAYAGSVSPRRVFNVVRGAMVERSKEAPFFALHQEDAAEYERLCRERNNSPCAAYVAASAILGKYGEAWKFMLSHYDRKSDWDITVCEGPDAGCGAEKTEKDLAAALPVLLKRWGYVAK